MRECKKMFFKGIICLLAVFIGMGNMTILAKTDFVRDELKVQDVIKTSNPVEAEKNTQVLGWELGYLAGDDLERYDEQFRVIPASAKNNGGAYWGTSINSAWDEDRNSFWETDAPNTNTHKNNIEFTFENSETFSRVIYGARADSGNKGFANKFEIWSSSTDSGENFQLVSQAKVVTTGSLIEIKFDEQPFKRLRFVWIEAKEDRPSARAFLFYKNDVVEEEIKGLFTDTACSSLQAGVDMAKIVKLQNKLNNHPVADSFQPYLDMAAKLISGSSSANDPVHEPIKLAQRGERYSEYHRTATTMTLGSFDLSGYYAIPGEVIEVFVDADAAGSIPRLVMAAVSQNTAWVYGYDGIELMNGYNRITIPETMKSAQAIYFYNPALPDQQKFAPIVRLIGGRKYPVYRYDANDTVEVTRQKERDFITELKAYEKNITDDYDEAKVGNGNYNIAEYVSDKILISVSARGAINSLDNTRVWDKGDFRDWEDIARFGETKYGIGGNLTGISYGGPAAVMECYEMLFDDIQVYSGFSNNDPTHPDYRNYGQFLFRAYNDGAGLGWGQNLFSGYNTGSQPNGSKWDSGFYEELVTVDTILLAGWAIFHEIGHVFDSSIIGSSESTNNLYGLMAQLKYTGTNRMAAADEDRWYRHFTSYINTGVLPQDDLLFYPGAVIYQLDAIDFSQTTIYQNQEAGDNMLSNYGRAGRYARLHRNQMNEMSYTDRLVISFSLACGVDLSTHFEYYGRSISEEAKRLISGLPKETRPTWIVNDRTFAGAAFSAEDKAKSPEILSADVNETSGEVTIKLKDGIFTDVNLQTFSIYRREVDASGTPVDDYKMIGVTGDSKATDVNELYLFKDSNVRPGKRYQYSVGAYDCTLMEATGRAETIVAIGEAAIVPLGTLLINEGDEGSEMNVGNTYKLQLVFAPANASVDLNAIRWTVEGYGRDEERTGGGPDIITLLPDPDFPKDPTRRIAKGIQYGQTHIKASIAGREQTHRMVINGQLDVDSNTYEFAFSDNEVSLVQGAKQKLNLNRSSKTIDEIVNVEAIRADALWRSKNPAIATVSNRGEVIAVAQGETEIEYVYKDSVLATSQIKVLSSPVAITLLQVSGAKTLPVGESRKLNLSITPANTTEAKKPVWSSSDMSIVSVDQSGSILAMKSGEATITATINAKTASHKVIVPAYIPLKHITMNQSTASLNGEGSTVELSMLKAPTNASATETTWRSNNPDIATVDGNGLVTGVSTGTAIITGFIDGKSATCTISVDVPTPLTGMKFRGKAENEDISVTIKVDEPYQLMAFPVPLNANNLSNTKWQSSNERVATVKEGYVTALSEGTTVIKGIIVQNEGIAGVVTKEITCTVTVVSNARALNNVGISHPSVGLEVGAELNLILTNQPTNANRASDGVNEIGSDSWVSSNPSIVSVDANGKIKTIGVGEAKITATRGGISITSDVVVHRENVMASSISLNKKSIVLKPSDAAMKLLSTISPTNATVGTYWKSSNPMVAKVDQMGNIQPVSVGESIITASANEQEASCKVVVSLNGEDPSIDTEIPSTPSDVVAGSITQTNAILTWKGSNDNVGVAGYRVYVNDTKIEEVDADTLTVDLKSLSPGTAYKARVIAFDQAGNESESALATFKTLALDSEDTVPSEPTDLQIEKISGGFATITWIEPADSSDISGYTIYLNGKKVGSVPVHTLSYVLGGLTANTAYEVEVVSYNSLNEESLRAAIKFMTTKEETPKDDEIPKDDETPKDDGIPSNPSDGSGNTTQPGGNSGETTQPDDNEKPNIKDSILADTADKIPNVPLNVRVKEITDISAIIAWDVPFDATDIVGYIVYKNGENVGEVTADTFTFALTNLTMGEAYEIAVSAYNSAKEEFLSEKVKFIANKELNAKNSSIPRDVVIDEITKSGGTVSWKAPSDEADVVGYIVYLDDKKIEEVKSNVLTTVLSKLNADTTYKVSVSAVNKDKHETKPVTVEFTTLNSFWTIGGVSILLFILAVGSFAAYVFYERKKGKK